MKRLTLLAAAAALGLTGCGKMTPAPVADRVPVKGKVTLADGRPVRDVMLTLQPLDSGQLAGLKVRADGSFHGEAVPGKYTYFLTPQEGAERRKSLAALKAVPERFKSAHLERTVEVRPGGDLQIKLN
jgi:hypothetical protein